MSPPPAVGCGLSSGRGKGKPMIVRMWMQRNVIVVGRRELATEAAGLMARKRVRRLPVIDDRPEGPRLAGMVSATDIVRAFPPNVNPFAVITPAAAPNPLTVGEIMTPYLVTTTPETPIEEPPP